MVFHNEESAGRSSPLTIFDLLFLLAVLASAAAFVALVISIARRRHAQALRTLKVYVLCALAYFTTGVTVAFLKPQRVISIGDPWCFDDWCLSVDGVIQSPEPHGNSYNIALRIFSRAGSVAQRAKGAWIYLIDDRGRLYSPDPDSSAVPLDVLLQPRQAVTTLRVFHVPPGARPIGLVTGHGGRYCGPMAFLVIGECGCMFRKPTMIGI